MATSWPYDISSHSSASLGETRQIWRELDAKVLINKWTPKIR